jgi:hypothetical protein
VDNIITYDSKKFNTIVVRRPSGVSGNSTNSISLIEFLVWVNSVNILPTNVSSIYFSLWTNKDEDIGHYGPEAPERIYDEIISDGSVSNSFGADNNSQNVALVINLNSLINVLDLQSLVLYNRVSSQARKDRAIGLGIELYNRQDDPTLINPVATTDENTTAEDVYRYDFPAIDTYDLALVGKNSIPVSNIMNVTYGTLEVNDFSNPVSVNNSMSITGNATVGGSLFLGDTNLTEVIDGLLTLDTNKRLTIIGLTSGFVTTGEDKTFQGKFIIPDSGNDLTLSGTQINFNSYSFISNTAGGNGGNHLVIFVK